MDTLGALALATEPPNDEMMKRSPVRRGDSFITKVMWRNILGQALYQLLVLGTLMIVGKRLLNIEGPTADKTINTLIFNSFVFCQVCGVNFTWKDICCFCVFILFSKISKSSHVIMQITNY